MLVAVEGNKDDDACSTVALVSCPPAMACVLINTHTCEHLGLTTLVPPQYCALSHLGYGLDNPDHLLADSGHILPRYQSATSIVLGC